MGYARDMCDIVVSHAGNEVRFFVRVDPDTRSQDVLYARDDLEWTEGSTAVSISRATYPLRTSSAGRARYTRSL